MTWSLFGAIATAVSIPLGERVYQLFSISQPEDHDGANIVRRIPRGYEDSTQAGSQAALQDIKNNDMKGRFKLKFRESLRYTWVVGADEDLIYTGCIYGLSI